MSSVLEFSNSRMKLSDLRTHWDTRSGLGGKEIAKLSERKTRQRTGDFRQEMLAKHNLHYAAQNENRSYWYKIQEGQTSRTSPTMIPGRPPAALPSAGPSSQTAPGKSGARTKTRAATQQAGSLRASGASHIVTMRVAPNLLRQIVQPRLSPEYQGSRSMSTSYRSSHSSTSSSTGSDLLRNTAIAPQPQPPQTSARGRGRELSPQVMSTTERLQTWLTSSSVPSSAITSSGGSSVDSNASMRGQSLPRSSSGRGASPAASTTYSSGSSSGNGAASQDSVTRGALSVRNSRPRSLTGQRTALKRSRPHDSSSGSVSGSRAPSISSSSDDGGPGISAHLRDFYEAERARAEARNANRRPPGWRDDTPDL